MIYNPEFNPRFDEDDDDDEEIEAYFCPECPGEMIRLMLPVRNLDTPEEEVIIEYIEREAIRQLDPEPDDIDWRDLLLCTACRLVMEVDDYDEADSFRWD